METVQIGNKTIAVKTIGRSPIERHQLRVDRIKREKEMGVERLPYDKLQTLSIDKRKVADSLYVTIGSDVKKRFFEAVGKLYILHKEIEDQRMLEIQTAVKSGVAFREEKNCSEKLKELKAKAVELGSEVKILRKSYYDTKVI